MRPLHAHCHLGLGQLYVKLGRCDDARAELSAAIELYRAMAMTFWWFVHETAGNDVRNAGAGIGRNVWSTDVVPVQPSASVTVSVTVTTPAKASGTVSVGRLPSGAESVAGALTVQA